MAASFSIDVDFTSALLMIPRSQSMSSIFQRVRSDHGLNSVRSERHQRLPAPHSLCLDLEDLLARERQRVNIPDNERFLRQSRTSQTLAINRLKKQRNTREPAMSRRSKATAFPDACGPSASGKRTSANVFYSKRATDTHAFDTNENQAGHAVEKRDMSSPQPDGPAALPVCPQGRPGGCIVPLRSSRSRR